MSFQLALHLGFIVIVNKLIKARQQRQIIIKCWIDVNFVQTSNLSRERKIEWYFLFNLWFKIAFSFFSWNFSFCLILSCALKVKHLLCFRTRTLNVSKELQVLFKFFMEQCLFLTGELFSSVKLSEKKFPPNAFQACKK